MIKVTGIAMLLLAQAEAMDEKKEETPTTCATTETVVVDVKENEKPTSSQAARSPNRTLTRQHGTSQLEFIKEMYDDSK